MFMHVHNVSWDNKYGGGGKVRNDLVSRLFCHSHIYESLYFNCNVQSEVPTEMETLRLYVNTSISLKMHTYS